MKKLLTFFQLTHKEQSGIILLLILLFILAFVHLIFSQLYPKQEIVYLLEEQAILSDSTGISLGGEEFQVNDGEVPKRTFFKFDPNHLDMAGWKKLGISEKQAQVILNYRSKGGRFYRKEDLRKIYSIRKEDVELLLPYVEIEGFSDNRDTFRNLNRKEVATRSSRKERVELNQADSLALMQLRGIGPVFAKRIVKFRDALGGFVNVSQVMEVYGMPEETYQEILPWIFVEEEGHKRIAINEVSIEELRKHPYVNWKMAQTIVRYREQHGTFESLSDLRKIHSLDEEFLRKIEFYLDFR